MKIILKKEVANLGEAGEVVEVRAGYALNYLIPQGIAIAATPSALKQHEETLRQRAHKEAKLVAPLPPLKLKKLLRTSESRWTRRTSLFRMTSSISESMRLR